jgi:phosphoribosyl-ATP pyrophosphohydrolase
MSMERSAKEIVFRLPEAAVLEQMAEEAAELAKAALKLARIRRGENPTPVTEDEAYRALCEEMADVAVCAKVLMEYEPVRFNEMQRYLKKIADKTLSQNLKELEADDLIIRTVYPQIPPKVEYSLTERGHSLVKVLDKLCDWGNENRR